MCGIVGYVGAQAALDVVLAGLHRVEPPAPPGYDAAGVAVLADGGLAAAKCAGDLPALRELLRRRPLPTGTTAVGHLRRGTHGSPSDVNAHPHLDNAGRVAVVHDGVIDNHAELRAELTARGHQLVSETDTEVVAHLLAEAFSSCQELGESMRQVCGALRGTFALLALHADDPETVVGARRGMPLAVRVGDGEAYLASDPRAFEGEAGPAREVVTLGAEEPDHVVVVRRDADEARLEITDARGTVVRA